jgi:hypothetical protein
MPRLFHGKVLMTVFQLSEETAIFFSKKEIPLAKYFSYVSWLQQLNATCCILHTPSSPFILFP